MDGYVSRKSVGKTARGIKTQLMGEYYHNMFNESESEKIKKVSTKIHTENKRLVEKIERVSCDELLKPLEDIRSGLVGLEYKHTANLMDQR